MTLELYKADLDNMRVIQRNSIARKKAPLLRQILKKVAKLVVMQRDVAKRGGWLRLVEVNRQDETKILMDRIDFEV